MYSTICELLKYIPIWENIPTSCCRLLSRFGDKTHPNHLRDLESISRNYCAYLNVYWIAEIHTSQRVSSFTVYLTPKSLTRFGVKRKYRFSFFGGAQNILTYFRLCRSGICQRCVVKVLTGYLPTGFLRTTIILKESLFSWRKNWHVLGRSNTSV